MNRQELSALAHISHPVAAPLGDDSVHRLLRQAVGDQQPNPRLLDLGCGRAEWLLRALAQHPGATAEGVDTSAEVLGAARERADALGTGDRLVLHEQDAAAFTSPHLFDVVVAVGACHAFGGLLETLAAARKHLAPGGRVLVGDAYWEREPTLAARETLGEYEDLATTVDRVVADGWTPVHGHLGTRHELDDYEWCWTGALASWALDHPGEAGSSQALETAGLHRTEWLRGYRDSFGFLALVLRRTEEGAP